MVANGRSPARHKQAEKYALANTTTVFEFARALLHRNSREGL